MTAAISYDSESEIVEADAESRLYVAAPKPHQKFVQIHESDGTIRLVPLDHLHESERAILENDELYNATRTGLLEFAAGERVSSDWLFEDE